MNASDTTLPTLPVSYRGFGAISASITSHLSIMLTCIMIEQGFSLGANFPPLSNHIIIKIITLLIRRDMSINVIVHNTPHYSSMGSRSLKVSSKGKAGRLLDSLFLMANPSPLDNTRFTRQ